jgi:hypothetical protein
VSHTDEPASTIRIVAADVISGKSVFLRVRDALCPRGETARRFRDHVRLRIEPSPAPSLLIENNPRHAALLSSKNSRRSSNPQAQLYRPMCSLSNVANRNEPGALARCLTRSGVGWHALTRFPQSDDGELTLFSGARYYYRPGAVAYSLFRCTARTTSSAMPSRSGSGRCAVGCWAYRLLSD